MDAQQIPLVNMITDYSFGLKPFENMPSPFLDLSTLFSSIPIFWISYLKFIGVA